MNHLSVILKSKDLQLRPITESDTDMIVLWRNKEDVRKNFLYREVFTIDYENSSAEFGIFIGEDSECGKGIGISVAKMILNYGHNKLGLHIEKQDL